MSVRLALARLAAGWQLSEDSPEFLRADLENQLCEYLERLENGFECSTEEFVLVAIYLSRMKERISLRHFSLRRCVLACLAVAVKFLHDDDSRASPDVHAYAGGVTRKEMSNLEIEILTLLDWRIFVDKIEFMLMRSRLQNLSQHCKPFPTPTAFVQAPLPFSMFSASMAPTFQQCEPAHMPSQLWAPLPPAFDLFPRQQPPCAATVNHPQGWPQPPSASIAPPLGPSYGAPHSFQAPPTCASSWEPLPSPAAPPVDFSTWSSVVFSFPIRH